MIATHSRFLTVDCFVDYERLVYVGGLQHHHPHNSHSNSNSSSRRQSLSEEILPDFSNNSSYSADHHNISHSADHHNISHSLAEEEQQQAAYIIPDGQEIKYHVRVFHNNNNN